MYSLRPDAITEGAAPSAKPTKCPALRDEAEGPSHGSHENVASPGLEKAALETTSIEYWRKDRYGAGAESSEVIVRVF